MTHLIGSPIRFHFIYKSKRNSRIQMMLRTTAYKVILMSKAN
ncbi:acyltransferase [Staphylococcus aureus]|nr:acyltransferase [Staphylococcus aureus]NAN23373.1 acyltransferase [Staphylococcus aureus]PGG83747.1 acyltransferase [Staphylococcus aureus]PNN87836.1 acyltransferase [Staphylococcus aureus]PSM68732.1 acyltransferase [Staphylococcus aureus]